MGHTRTLITAEQLYEIASNRRCELVRGEVVEMAPVGLRHGDVGSEFVSWLRPFAKRGLGRTGTDVGFILFRNPDTVRAPDVYFLCKGRTGRRDDRGFYEGAPDLAFEVLSPNDTASEVQEKVREYLAAGTRLVLVADPPMETLAVYQADKPVRFCSGEDQVSLDPIVPGFSFRVADLFV